MTPAACNADASDSLRDSFQWLWPPPMTSGLCQKWQAALEKTLFDPSAANELLRPAFFVGNWHHESLAANWQWHLNPATALLCAWRPHPVLLFWQQHDWGQHAPARLAARPILTVCMTCLKGTWNLRRSSKPETVQKCTLFNPGHSTFWRLLLTHTRRRHTLGPRTRSPTTLNGPLLTNDNFSTAFDASTRLGLLSTRGCWLEQLQLSVTDPTNQSGAPRL